MRVKIYILRITYLTMLKRFFEPSYFFSNVLVPAIALGLYCFSFAYLSARFQLEGVNYFFASKFGKVVLFLIAGTIVIFLGLLLFKRNKLSFGALQQRSHRGDILLLLLPLTPVVQYTLVNRDMLSPAEVLYILLFFIFCSAIYILLIPALLSLVIPTRTLMIVGLAFVFTIVSMASVSDYFSWFEKGALRKQLIGFGGVFLLVWILYSLNQRKVVYLFVMLSFTVNSAAILLSQRTGTDSAAASMEENYLLALTAKRRPASEPSIYLLIYDAYVPNETMLGYGIDNSAQEDFLRDQGFKLYPHTYSIAATTLSTMSRVLNVSTEYYGNTRRAVSGDGVTQNLVKRLGYKTYGLFHTDFMFRGIGSSYDISIPEFSIPPYLQLIKAILLGEFRFNIEDAGFGMQHRNQFLEAKQEIFQTSSGNPVFMYMHSSMPAHSQNSGACLPNETDLFKERLRHANEEMQQDVRLIIENDPDAIVIVAGDHGPYLTKNCSNTNDGYDISEVSRQDIQDRYGTFLAIRWPTGDYVEYDDITVLQDLFPAVFAYLFKDATILESKIDPVIPAESPNWISGASVKDGIIIGGMDDGERLFSSEE